MSDKSLRFRGESRHKLATSLLSKIGKLAGCEVWVASDDKNKKFKGIKLGENCLQKFPDINLPQNAIKRLKKVDVIWFKDSIPVYAFEIETTTKIYSGLLRLSDLCSSVPTLKMSLNIVAQQARQENVIREILRPTFQRVKLNDFFGYIPLEDLDSLHDSIKALKKGLSPNIIDNIILSHPTEGHQ